MVLVAEPRTGRFGIQLRNAELRITGVFAESWNTVMTDICKRGRLSTLVCKGYNQLCRRGGLALA